MHHLICFVDYEFYKNVLTLCTYDCCVMLSMNRHHDTRIPGKTNLYKTRYPDGEHIHILKLNRDIIFDFEIVSA